MKGKDIVLLGFLYSATKYLKSKNSNYALENYDTLEKDVKNVFDNGSEINKSYFLAGESVFDKYLKEKENDSLNELRDIFDNIEVKQIEDMVNIYKDVPNEDADEEELLRKISIAAADNVNKKHEVNEETSVKELDRVFNEIVDYENESKEYEKEVIDQEEIIKEKPKKKLNRNDQYVSDLMNELANSKLSQQNHKTAVEKVKAYESIAKMYPYLPGDFIRSVYNLKDSIAYDYKLDQEIVLLHRVNFKELDDLRKFVEIVAKHGYTVNVDENKMIVDVLRGFVNEDGKILSNIFDIANQAKVLLGTYEGYKVFEKEELDEVF